MPMSFAICHLSFVICHLSLNTRNYLLPPQLRANPNPARSATATKNKSFAQRLHNDLRAMGVRCWLDEKQMLPCDDIYEQVDRGIRLWDKVLLCASGHSLHWRRRKNPTRSSSPSSRAICGLRRTCATWPPNALSKH